MLCLRSPSIASMQPEERYGVNVRTQAAGLSQEQLGARAEHHRTEISLLERTAQEPRLSTIVRVARALRVRPAELLDGIK